MDGGSCSHILTQLPHPPKLSDVQREAVKGARHILGEDFMDIKMDDILHPPHQNGSYITVYMVFVYTN